MKIFWRVVLPFVLACGLAIAGAMAMVGSRSSLWGFVDWRFDYVLAGAAFVVLLFGFVGKTLRWGKEAEEYEELLHENQEHDGNRPTTNSVSRDGH
jgi:hypothetical protein